MTEVVAILLAAFVGALSGILTTTWKTRKDLEAQYDIDLRKRRIEAYTSLWKELDVLADYAPPGDPTHEGMGRLSEALRRWYFERGGLFLSVKTRGPYFNLQEALKAIASDHDGGRDDVLDDDTAKVVKSLASRLRTSTTDDVATRVGPRLAGSFASRVRRRWRRVRRPVRATVDRRWAWNRGRAEACYFVLIENRSDREVQITSLELDGVTPRLDKPLLVQAGEPREIAVTPTRDDGAVGRVVRVAMVLSDGRRIETQNPPDVPISTVTFEQRPAAPAEPS